MLTAIARLELRFHAREFLTYIYLLVFFLLTFAFASGASVELVSERGATPRGAPWTLAHAMAGLTAFGQLMTAFIAAAAVLRDAATRMEPLLFTTALTRRAYIGGKLIGAMVTMLVVYLAIPAGLLLGALMPWAPPDAMPASTTAFLWPLLVLIAPNVILVTAAFFTAGMVSRSFMAVAITGLLLVGAWQTGLALASAEDTRMLGALLDPFGNAAIIATTAGWDVADRAARELPMSAYIVVNRAFWSLVGLGLVVLVMTRFRLTPHTVTSPEPARSGTRGSGRSLLGGRILDEPVAASEPSWVNAAAAWTRLTIRTLLTEKGFVAIALLGVTNAAVNLVMGDARNAATIAETIVTHGRIFLILLATIYAGELVWRERDTRIGPLVDAAPASSTAEVAGKAAALAIACGVIALLLAAIGGSVLLVRAGASELGTLLVAGALLPAAMLLALALLSLAVHALMQHQVRAHFALIAAWVVGVTLAEGGNRVALGELVRADALMPSLRIAALLCLAGVGFALAALAWSRGSPRG